MEEEQCFVEFHLLPRCWRCFGAILSPPPVVLSQLRPAAARPGQIWGQGSWPRVKPVKRLHLDRPALPVITALHFPCPAARMELMPASTQVVAKLNESSLVHPAMILEIYSTIGMQSHIMVKNTRVIRHQ